MSKRTILKTSQNLQMSIQVKTVMHYFPTFYYSLDISWNRSFDYEVPWQMKLNGNVIFQL